MSKNVFVSACCILIVLCGSATAVNYRWSFETGSGGTSVASIKNRDGAILSISCAKPGNRSMNIDLDNTPLLKAGTTDLQIVVAGESFDFELTGSEDCSGREEIAGRNRINRLAGLVDALVKTKRNSFVVELPAAQKQISFSTLDARKWLKGLLDGCL
jgi:hypothetical protein